MDSHDAGHRKKLYCYVDESGQDDRSRFFVVVAVVSDQDQETLREALIRIERSAKTSGRKWHKARPSHRLKFLSLALEKNLGQGDVFFGVYQKPIPFFFPMLDVIEYAIKESVARPYSARVFVDGIDRMKAQELTNALRLRNISVHLIQSRRDESEPVIRLADMWAGCIRSALLGSAEERAIVDEARARGYLKARKEKPL